MATKKQAAEVPLARPREVPRPSCSTSTKRTAGLEILALAGFATVPVWRQPYQRGLQWIGGKVGTGAPILIKFTGAKRRALAEKERLENYGYKVEVKRAKKSKT